MERHDGNLLRSQHGNHRSEKVLNEQSNQNGKFLDSELLRGGLELHDGILDCRIRDEEQNGIQDSEQPRCGMEQHGGSLHSEMVLNECNQIRGDYRNVVLHVGRIPDEVPMQCGNLHEEVLDDQRSGGYQIRGEVDSFTRSYQHHGLHALPNRG